VQDCCDVGELVNDGPDLGFGHAAGSLLRLTHCECVGSALGFGLGDPSGDGGRVSADVERGAVLG
jgi:hypothetical protein